MATKFTIVYRDGTERAGWFTPRALLAFEREYGDKPDQKIRGALYAAWTELNIDGDLKPFDEWIDMVLDYEEQSGQDPRPATQSEPSLPSPPLPA